MKAKYFDIKFLTHSLSMLVCLMSLAGCHQASLNTQVLQEKQVTPANGGNNYVFCTHCLTHQPLTKKEKS